MVDFEGLFDKTLDKDTPIPLHYQLRELLLDYVSRLSEYTVLPTESDLCVHFGISRSTVRQAMGALSEQGLLIRRKGKGTMVAPRKIEQDFLVVLESFNDEMQHKGLEPWTRVVAQEILRAPSEVAQALNLGEEDETLRLQRLRGVGNAPVVLVTTFIPMRIGNLRALAGEDFEHESLYRLMSGKYGIVIASSRRILDIRTAGYFEAELLGIAPKEPVQHIETVSFDEAGRKIEYSLADYRSDNNKFVIEVRNTKIRRNDRIGY